MFSGLLRTDPVLMLESDSGRGFWDDLHAQRLRADELKDEKDQI